jgi:serine/threonine protein kinase
MTTLNRNGVGMMSKYRNWNIIKKCNKQDTEQSYIVNYSGKNEKKFMDNKFYMLKTLSNQKDPERRSRMLREISNLKSLNHCGIPKIYDANVEYFEDESSRLFYVTDYVEGTNLKNMIRDHKFTFEEKLQSFLHLIDIVAYCHENGVYHQHISHHNIICRNNNMFDLLLIDYGLSFNIIAEQSKQKSLRNQNQQLLHLPEQDHYQVFQRHDPRSDITLCCGILFYMLTNQNPLYLQDHYMMQPHQRASARIKLKEVTRTHFDKFSHIFDIAFNIDIDKRFQSFNELKTELTEMVENLEVRSITPVFELASQYNLSISNVYKL